MIHPSENLIYGGWDADEKGINEIRTFCKDNVITEKQALIKRKGPDVYLELLTDIELPSTAQNN